MSWHPKIVAFCCNWCAYAGADLAGISRKQYSSDIRILRVMCSGRVDPALLLKCYEQGADGVMVLGCHPGDCHYLSGNEEAQKRVESAKNLLELLGIDTRRLLLAWVSASEGERFAKTADEFVKIIRGLGPLGGDSNDR
jgi:F420-non-reducing hydrogenase iron-sulfur subunit